MSSQKILRAMMIGDIVGTPGLEILEKNLPELIKEHKIDFVTVNGENAAEGFGMTEHEYHRIIAAGADVITSGNHIWEKRDFWPVLENNQNILRPANYPSAGNNTVPGIGYTLIKKNESAWLVINLQGRELMNAIDCPFECLDLIIKKLTAEHSEQLITLVDFHAESTREKEALAYHADGRVSLFAGTHTHVQTADERILPNGAAYITDLGMTGINNSVIGMDIDICRNRFSKQIQYQMKTAVSDKPGQIQGVIAEIDAETGKAVYINRI